MKGKFFVVLLGLVFCLCIFLSESKPILAEEWTAEQKEIVDWFKKYTEVAIEGDLEGIWSHFHNKFSGWDYTKVMNEGVIYDMTWLKNSHKELYKNLKMTLFDIETLEIKIEGNIAIAHVNFVEKLQDSGGNEITYSGPWTSALIKQDGKWLFMSWSSAIK